MNDTKIGVEEFYWRKRAEAAEDELQRLREQEPVRFHCHSRTFAPAYVCNKPGDMSGYYYPEPIPSPDVLELVNALHKISLASQNSMSSKEECGRISRVALAKFRGQS